MAHTAHDSSGSSAAQALAKVGSFSTSATTKALFGVSALIGLVLTALAIKSDPTRAWSNYLINFFFFISLALCGAFFMALQHVTNSYWSVTVRRVAEALVSYLVPGVLLGLVLFFFGKHYLYEWSHHEEMLHDPILALKASYLNSGAVLFRYVVFGAISIGLSFWIRSNSLQQDVSGDKKITLKNIKLSTVFIPLFAFSYSLMAVDFLMALEPHWFSTIYGVYCFAGLFYSGLALIAFLVIRGRQSGVFSELVVNDNHVHDIGKLMFGFTVFWAYIFFSQFMLQWYANIPEEITYYLRRSDGGWFKYGFMLVLVHFVIPFFALLPRQAKRCASYLSKIAVFMLITQWLDVYYLVMPVFFKSGPVFGWIEVGTFLLFFGIFGISVGRFLEKNKMVPVKDPRIEACLRHAQ